jgi:hypothetical protein
MARPQALCDDAARMNPRIPEKNKKPGVCYAVTRDGLELPVVDVTHPTFALAVSDASLADLAAEFVRDERRRSKLPVFLQRLILKLVLRGSVLGRGVLAADGTYVTGMNTYLMKVGPDNLGQGYAKPLDRRIAAALPPMAVRLRLQDMVRLLADGLGPALAARPGEPLRLLNIAGGPAADSLNTLLVLRKEHPEWIADRKISVEVFDGDDEGPEFGARSLAALLAAGAPLHGLQVDFLKVSYDWRDVSALRRHLGASDGGTIVAASSEGGLFEYGSDDAIGSNLEALRAGMPVDGIVVGSVTRADGPAQQVKSSIRVATRPRTLDDFTALARRSGWAIARALEAPFSYNVSLRKA